MPVALATVVPLALTVPGKAPYATMAEMLKAMQASGKPFSFASAGTGTPGHFAGEYLSAKLPGKLVHVPYKGAGPGAQRHHRRPCRHVFSGLSGR